MSLLENCIREDFGLIDNGNRWCRSVQHTSLVYDKESDRFYWNSMGIFGNFWDYLTRVRNMQPEEIKGFVKHNKPNVYEEVIAAVDTPPIQLPELVTSFYNLGKNNREYWHEKRGYTDKTIDDFMLGFTGEWYCIPIFVDGEFKNFQLRKDNPKKISQWYSKVGLLPFNFSILRYTDWVVIAESPVDAIMLRQNDIPAVSQNGGASSWDISWTPRFMKLNKIYIVYDNDQAGMDGSIKVARNFGYKAKIFNFFEDFPYKFDATDFFKEGGSKEMLMNLLLTRAVTYDKLEWKER